MASLYQIFSKCFGFNLLNTDAGTEELSPWLRVLAALTEHPVLIPSTEWWLTTTGNATYRESDALFWPL